MSSMASYAGFDLAQTFYVDSDAVQRSNDVFLTSVDLYFFNKPVEGKADSGIYSPGVSVFITGTNEDGTPNFQKIYHLHSARREYADISTSLTGTAATTFTFKQPIHISTGYMYAILVKFDGNDPGFMLWYNKSGETVSTSSSQSQVSSGKVDGHLYRLTNGASLTPNYDQDLSFKMRVAKFAIGSSTFKIKNRGYEFLKVLAINGNFLGGESVYQQRAAATGTVSVTSTSQTVTGTGTSFTSVLAAGDKFVITDGTPGNTNIRTVASVTNSTSMVLEAAPTFTNTSGTYYKTVTGSLYQSDNLSDYIVLQDSTANSSVYLTVGTTIYGVDSQAYANISAIEDYTASAVSPAYTITIPNGTTVDSVITVANSSYAVDTTKSFTTVNGKKTVLDLYPAAVASRTVEKTTATPFTSLTTNLVFSTTNPYMSPYVREDNLDMFVDSYVINNDDTNEYLGRGNADSRYISKIVNLSSEQYSEDLKVFARVFQPSGTSVKLYARFKNSSDNEPMSSKNWTELSPTVSDLEYSNQSNKQDQIELSYDVPFYHSGTRITDKFTTTLSSAVVTGFSGAVNTSIITGDVVRISSPYFPDNHLTDIVVSSNTTTFTLRNAIANSSIVGTGFLVDNITRKNSAFLDVQNQNVLTYFSSTGARFEGYDSFQIKVIPLSADGVAIPYINDVRAIAVSA